MTQGGDFDQTTGYLFDLMWEREEKDETGERCGKFWKGGCSCVLYGVDHVSLMHTWIQC